MRCNVTEQMQCTRRIPRVTRRAFDCSIAKATRIVKAVEQQTGAP
jgi:hypothetical protein